MVSRAFSANFPSCGAPYSCPFRLSFHSQQLSAPWVHAPSPTFQHPAPPPQQETHDSGWVHRGAAQTMHAVLCPAFHRPSAVFTFEPLNVTFCPSYFPHREGVFWVQGPLFTFSLPPGLLVPFLIPLFFFSFFRPTQLWGVFSCPFGCAKSSTDVQHVLCENCSICRCILDILVRRDDFPILLFYHLDSSFINFLIVTSKVWFPVTLFKRASTVWTKV